MDELKLLIEMVNGLPTLAVWVLVGYLVYKVAVIGSAYGVIRLLICKVHDWKTAPRTFKIGGKPINSEVAEELNAQIIRLGQESSYSYYHLSDVTKLKQALDIVLAKK